MLRQVRNHITNEEIITLKRRAYFLSGVPPCVIADEKREKQEGDWKVVVTAAVAAAGDGGGQKGPNTHLSLVK